LADNGTKKMNESQKISQAQLFFEIASLFRVLKTFMQGSAELIAIGYSGVRHGSAGAQAQPQKF